MMDVNDARYRRWLDLPTYIIVEAYGATGLANNVRELMQDYEPQGGMTFTGGAYGSEKFMQAMVRRAFK